MTTHDLVLHLREMADGVESGDSLEGSVTFTADGEDSWNVDGAYRVGNLMGQGGMVLLSPRCIGYPDCDGDLEATPHSEKCPRYKEPESVGAVREDSR